jgi:hypothetical protein
MKYTITNLSGAKTLAAKLRRWMNDERGDDGGYKSVVQRGNTLIVEKTGSAPWAELVGHMTIDTQIKPSH